MQIKRIINNELLSLYLNYNKIGEAPYMNVQKFDKNQIIDILAEKFPRHEIYVIENHSDEIYMIYTSLYKFSISPIFRKNATSAAEPIKWEVSGSFRPEFVIPCSFELSEVIHQLSDNLKNLKYFRDRIFQFLNKDI